MVEVAGFGAPPRLSRLPPALPRDYSPASEDSSDDSAMLHPGSAAAASMTPGLHPATARLLARQQYAQRTPEWYAVRRDMLTASDAAAALGVKPYASYRGCPRADLVRKKVRGDRVSNMATAHGQAYEDEARDWAAAALGESVVDVGLVRHATLAWLGASPDGVTLTGKLLEIKCPMRRAIEPGVVPHHYYPQVQCQMEVCDVDQTIFVQYKPASLSRTGARQLDVVVIERDRAWFERHRADLEACWREFMEARATAPPPTAADLAEAEAGVLRCEILDDGMYDDLDMTMPSARAAARKPRESTSAAPCMFMEDE